MPRITNIHLHRDEIADAYFNGADSTAMIGQRYGVCGTTVAKLMQREFPARYQKEGGQVRAARVSGLRNKRDEKCVSNRWTDEQQEEVKRLYLENRLGSKAILKIMPELNCAHASINAFLRGEGVRRVGHTKNRGGAYEVVNGVEIGIKRPPPDPWKNCHSVAKKQRRLGVGRMVSDLPLFQYANREKARLRVNHLYRNDPQYRLMERTRQRLQRMSLTGKATPNTQKIIGCSAEYYFKHVERQFDEGMTWDNAGTSANNDKWHIDHIVPCKFFDLSNPEELRVCFNWRNLRPLWCGDNISKGDSFAKGMSVLLESSAIYHRQYAMVVQMIRRARLHAA